MSSPWRWNPDKRRYRHSETGQTVSQDKARALHEDFEEEQEDEFEEAAAALALAGIAGLAAWESVMRETITDTFAAEYALGLGGLAQFEDEDYEALSEMRDEQVEDYLPGFADDIRAGRYEDAEGNLSVAAITARAALYAVAAHAAFEAAKAKSYGLDMSRLPHLPGDGSTRCRTNCNCHWEIVETDDGWECTWVLGDGEHCEDCEERAGEYAPLVLARE